jgi:hypothetical protein
VNRKLTWRVRPRRMKAVAALSVVVATAGLLAAEAAGATSSLARTTTVSAATTAASASASAGAFHQTRTITRTNLINGQDVLVEKRKVSLSVNITKNLIDQQVINVSWTGAHPTGGIEANPNDAVNAQYQEYPMVLLQCHGVPGSKRPLAEQITPQTCWTSTPSERFYAASPEQPYPPWRLDRYATAAGQRDLDVNQPNPLPKTCGLLPGPHFWLPYVTPTGKSYPVGQGGCAGMPNEMSLLGGLGALPSNETFAVTGLNGKGNAAFDVWTNTVNPDLGCSQKVSCAVVAVPIMGISCDPAAAGMPVADQPTAGQEPAAASACEATGAFAPGSLLPQGELGQEDVTVSGSLWWAASNWRNRFVVPLHFAPAQNICSVAGKNNRLIQIYGSELMDQALLQWEPHFCLNKKLFSVGYVSEAEPEAALDLQTGQIDAALVSDQPSAGFPNPVIHAPVGATGFAISFTIDNAKGTPVTTLRLDPRLIAKLLTESYPAVSAIADADPELLHHCPGVPVSDDVCTNPLNITDDPEFQALNPGITKGVGASAAASALLALSSQSNVMWALTSYINDNPAARAWLNGTPDPWGMTVNSAYKGIKLPVSIWPLLSTFEPAEWLTGNGAGPGLCYTLNPSPALPLIAAPQLNMYPDIETEVQFYQAQAQLACAGNPSVPQSLELVALGQQTVGDRFMMGITTLADARRYSLHAASLLTHVKKGTPAKFTSAKGMTFVAPTDSALRSAVSLLRPDTKGYDWNFPYVLYKKDSAKAANAYPGTMLVYADVPTKGLTSGNAADYAAFLRFAATGGQRPGGGVGHLPAGYLPMTSANHLGAQAAYTQAVATAVAAQAGVIPALITRSPTGSPGPSPSASPASTSGPGAGSTGPGSSSPPSGSSSSSPTPGSSGSAKPISLSPEANFGVAGFMLPAVAGLALLAALGAVLVPRLVRARSKKWN